VCRPAFVRLVVARVVLPGIGTARVGDEKRWSGGVLATFRAGTLFATDQLTGLLAASDPRGEVATAWHANYAVRELYAHRDAELALEWVDQLSADMRDRDCPPEVRQLGRALHRWRDQIAAWHGAQVTNDPTESCNNIAKRIKRVD
jgi:hypothetical protein